MDAVALAAVPPDPDLNEGDSPAPVAPAPTITLPRDLVAAATAALGLVPISTAGGQVARIFLAMQEALARAERAG